MSLLSDIQDAVIDSNTNLATLLRKCKVLATRLGNDDFKNWVENELNGYKSNEELPEYRILDVNSKGHFSDKSGSIFKNLDILINNFPEENRQIMSTCYLTHHIATLESLVRDSKNGIVQEPWDPGIVSVSSQIFYQNMSCIQAWKIIPVSNLVGLLDEVRNKILTFVLKSEFENTNDNSLQINSNQENILKGSDMTSKCIVCNSNSENSDQYNEKIDYTVSKCVRCGSYIYDLKIGHIIEFLDVNKKMALSHWIRKENEKNKAPNFIKLAFSKEFFSELELPDLITQANNLIIFLGKNLNSLSDSFDFDQEERTKLPSLIGSFDFEDSQKIIDHLKKINLIENGMFQYGSENFTLSLTFEGRAKYEELKKNMNMKSDNIQVLLSSHPDALKLYNSALQKYKSGKYERNLLDDLRLSLEYLVKDILKNSKSLEKQNDLGKYLKVKGVPPALRNTFTTLVTYYTKYQNDHVKHNHNVNIEDIELIKEQTESFIKHLIKLDNK